MKSITSGFSSALQGFRFINRFELGRLVSLPGLRQVSWRKLVFGLCGGMCYAALDYFHAHQPVPTYPSVEQLDPRFLRYLQRRQSDSVPLPVLIKLVSWIFLKDSKVVRRTLGREIPRLRFHLDYGMPVVLILVRTQGFRDPTQNHQVIAAGYTDDAECKQLHIFLYDPNHPLEEAQLTIDYSIPGQEHITQSTGEKLRGFFVTPYRPKSPIL